MKRKGCFPGGVMTAVMMLLPCSHALAEQACMAAASDASDLQQIGSHNDLPNARADLRQVAPSSLRACLLSPETILAARNHFTLVDVRPAADAAILRIPQVLNLRPADIGNSPFLPGDGHIVLVGDGSDTARLLRICLEESTDGSIAVSVMAGGIRAWHRAGGDVVGNSQAFDQPWIVASPVVGELIQLPGTWLIGDMTHPSLAESSRHYLNVAGLDPRAAAKQVRARSRGDTPLATILLLDGDDDLSSWQRAFLSAGLPEPMFHRHGGGAYIAWAKQQANVNSQIGRPLGLGCRWN